MHLVLLMNLDNFQFDSCDIDSLACFHIDQKEVAFVEGWLLSSQLKQF